ncbi:Variable outer membrane protein (plasmid) [Borrelia crocidurae DOU]|uniref:Variable large protein n=1 Tax=Borrelia crocidurae DOU TaxID=1293575 RepID=W5SJ78_9SPIR|nr:Variable outer membrane protein [Borrelia crocidurae DOU]
MSFGDMITGTLGIKAETKKSEIGGCFGKIENTMKAVKGKLSKILEEHGNYEKVKEKIDEFIEKISKIEEGAKEAAGGTGGSDVIGNALQNQDAVPAAVDSVNKIVSGIKIIVGIVLKEGEGNAEATKTAENEKKSVGGLFAKGTANDGTEAQAAAASASVGVVSGADILQAISKSVNANTKDIDAVTNAAEISVANKDSATKTLDKAQIDAVISAGIALRAMAKDGKFAAKNEDKSANAVNGAVASAVNKVLSTLIIAIRNTVDEGLKGISEVLGEIKQGEGSESKTN